MCNLLNAKYTDLPKKFSCQFYFSFEYANLRDTTHVVEYLRPQSNYMFEVMVVMSRDLQSEYSVTVYAFTRDKGKL